MGPGPQVPGVSTAPEVSVVMATWNSRATLQRALDSVFAQRDARVEVLVADGGSRDGTQDVLARNADRLAYWVSEPDTGIYAAWNKLVRRAKGDWLCFLGSDDTLHDERALAALLVARSGLPKDCRFIYGRLNLVSRRGLVAQTVGSDWHAARTSFLDGFMLPHPAMLHHRSLFERHGLFDESYRIAGDYEFALRELKAGSARFVDRIIVDMRLGGSSGRPDSIHDTLREVARARAAHGLGPSPLKLRVALATSWLAGKLYRIAGARAFEVVADAYRFMRGRPRIWTV